MARLFHIQNSTLYGEYQLRCIESTVKFQQIADLEWSTLVEEVKISVINRSFYGIDGIIDYFQSRVKEVLT
jgi:hypothetical protein